MVTKSACFLTTTAVQPVGFVKIGHLKQEKTLDKVTQEKNIILDTLGPHMACLKDPVKFIRDICQKQNQTHVLTEAYKLINQMEPNKFQTMIPYDIANLAVDIALENINKVANHTTGKMVPKENKMEPHFFFFNPSKKGGLNMLTLNVSITFFNGKP